MEHVNIENCFKEMSKDWGGQEKWLHVCSNVLVGESMMASAMGSVFQLSESVGVTKKKANGRVEFPDRVFCIPAVDVIRADEGPPLCINLSFQISR